MTQTQDVIFSELSGVGGNLGVITLNRPAALNSLNHAMIHAIHQSLDVWSKSPDIKAVVIQAVEGRAFCAGGDIRLVYEKAKQSNPDMTDFFYDEYHLNRAIFHFPKPYIALLDGITMGGGVGISIHGSHRVVTDRVLFAMPETGIGFFPDVGGTYFLPRLPHAAGYYLGLTGARIKADDCVALGLATHKVSQDNIPAIVTALCQTDFGGHARNAVSEILSNFNTNPTATPLQEALHEIKNCFVGDNVQSIIQRLQSATHSVCQEALVALQKKSPTSLIVTLQALNNGNNLDFDACMRQEFRLVTRFLLGHDFIEGIRAAIIDKGQAPAWQPATLAEVSAQAISTYFAPLNKELA